jgi:hypothetical protein
MLYATKTPLQPPPPKGVALITIERVVVKQRERVGVGYNGIT